MVWYGLVWFSMVWSGLEGSKSTTISQSLSDEGGHRAARAAKRINMYQYFNGLTSQNPPPENFSLILQWRFACFVLLQPVVGDRLIEAAVETKRSESISRTLPRYMTQDIWTTRNICFLTQILKNI